MATPHNEANVGDIASVVLMPGDPLRAKYIAEHYLEDVKQFNAVRNMFGYTGTYKGHRVSVMGSGMGMPSIGIYSYELYKFYEVDKIIRIGSAGAYDPNLKVFDLVLASEAWSKSSYALTQAGVEGNIQYPSASLNEKIIDTAKRLDQPLVIGRIHSSDNFYLEDNVPNYKNFYEEEGCICVEMESYALFHNARILGKEAACLLTISDSMVTHEETTSKERENSFHAMMEVALESVL